MMPQLLIQNISASICCNILLAWIWLESAALPPRPVFCGYSDNLSGVRTVAEKVFVVKRRCLTVRAAECLTPFPRLLCQGLRESSMPELSWVAIESQQPLQRLVQKCWSGSPLAGISLFPCVLSFLCSPAEILQCWK